MAPILITIEHSGLANGSTCRGIIDLTEDDLSKGKLIAVAPHLHVCRALLPDYKIMEAVSLGTGVSEQTNLPCPRHVEGRPCKRYLCIGFQHLLPMECDQQLSLPNGWRLQLENCLIQHIYDDT